MCRESRSSVLRLLVTAVLLAAILAPLFPEAVLAAEVLTNPGFETGSLPPWYTNGPWTVVSTGCHTGNYCAYDVGNYYIQQDFAGVPADDVASVTFWMRQPEQAISWVELRYSDATTNGRLVWPTSSWQQFDISDLLVSGKTLTGIRIFGYSGGGPDPDETFLDDVSIQTIDYASIGDWVWEDLDGDGVQNDGPTGISGVTVNLYDEPGGLVDTTTTLADGSYAFTQLVPGNYYLEFVLPAAYTFTLQDQGGNDELDSDADPVTGQTILTTLDPAENDPSWDAGMIRLLSLGDLAWYDTNQDGIQDPGEPGVQDIAVDLHDNGTCAGTPVASTTTDATGFYGFTDLLSGTYCLQFYDIPAGWLISPPNQGGDDTRDSDVDPATGQITDIALTADDPDEDMGVYSEGSIGDTAWCDADGNGLYDPGEGVDGVTISLYDDPECDSIPNSLLATQDTVSDGQYLFVELWAGPPAGPPICYVGAVDVLDMGACNSPITPITQPVALDALDPDDLEIDFGFVNDPPVAFDDWGFTDEDTVLTVTAPGVLVNDVDPGDILTVVAHDDPSDLGASVNVDPDGGYRYDPDGQFEYLAEGQVLTDTFSYTISDTASQTDTATVSVVITGVNDAPVAFDDVYTTTEDTPLVVGAPGVLGNDDDVDSTDLTAVWDSGPANGDLTLNADGSFTYTPTVGFVGIDAFTYHVTDELTASNVATVTLNVTQACVEVTGVTLTMVTTGTIYPDDPVDLEADIAPDDATKPYSYTIDWDDGTVVTATSGLDPLVLSHSYTATGSYTVLITVWNCDGTQPVTDTITVVVSPPQFAVFLPLVMKQ